jgi:Lipocalin-like domain
MILSAPRVLASVLLVATTLTATAQSPAEMKQRFIGSFRLVSWTSYDAAGQASPSPYTMGQITYDAADRMSAHLMTAERAKLAATRQPGQRGGGAGAPPDMTGYISYYGRYEIDPKQSTVTHHVEGSSNLGMIGTPQLRYYELSADGRTLFLSTKSGDRVTGRLRWERY